MCEFNVANGKYMIADNNMPSAVTVVPFAALHRFVRCFYLQTYGDSFVHQIRITLIVIGLINARVAQFLCEYIGYHTAEVVCLNNFAEIDACIIAN